MAINFCLSQFCPAISCPQLSADDYEVTNLISSSPQRLRRGFRAEHFIKPPIEITVRFPYCIDVSHIVLGVRSGPQQTSAVKLFSEYPRFAGKRKWDYQFIGKCDNAIGRKLCFENCLYKPRDPFTKCTVSPEKFEEPDIQKLSFKSDVNISSTQKLKVCLVRVANSGVAVLSELQVWGQPSRVCNREVIEKIFSLISHHRPVPSEVPQEDKFVVKSVADTQDTTKNDDNEIPPEFLDSITHEIMVLPMVLPSGNVVDQQTIEKCKASQESYGRTAMDPFTGIPFHGENQPVFNAALKARIDQFLVQKGSSLNVPRSIGTRENVPCKLRKSSLYSCTSVSSVTKKDACDGNSMPAAESVSQPKLHCTKRKNTLAETNTKRRCTTVTSLKSPDTVLICSETPCVSPRDSALTETIHAEKRSQSLKAALQDLLGTTRRFTNFSKPTKPEPIKCVACSCEHAHSLFQLPCTHIICRDCMVGSLKMPSPVCNLCNTVFSSDSVERVFV